MIAPLVLRRLRPRQDTGGGRLEELAERGREACDLVHAGAAREAHAQQSAVGLEPHRAAQVAHERVRAELAGADRDAARPERLGQLVRIAPVAPRTGRRRRGRRPHATA